MKKLLSLGALALGVLALASCSKDNEGVVKKDILGVSNGQVEKLAESKLFFKKDSTIPYIPLEECKGLLTLVRSANLDSQKYGFNLKKNNNEFTLENETGAKCVINADTQTLTYDDYDALTSVVPDTQKPLSLFNVNKTKNAIKLVSTDYKKGNEVKIDLNKYSKLDIYVEDGACYIPLSVFNSLLFNTCESVSLAYNGVSLFLVPSGSLSTEAFGTPMETALGEKIREGAKKSTITQEYLDYYYQSLCLDFDIEYGLKEKFKSFDEFLTSKNLKNAIYNTDIKTSDSNLAIALTYLQDGHTALSEFSYYYDFGDNSVDKTKFNQEVMLKEEADVKFTKSKSNAQISNGLDYSRADDTVFIDFGKFTELDTDALYQKSTKDEFDLDDIGIPGLDFGKYSQTQLNNTGCIFNQLYLDLTQDENKKNVKNIVVDLTTNTGGAADGLVYSLSTLIGNVAVDLRNPLTGATNHQVFKADINTDGKVDENDKDLASLGYNIYFLNSRYSFSSANAMPVLAKLNNPNVINLGDKTGGGPCAVRENVSPLGNVISTSSLSTISKVVDGKYVNIDGGVDADFKLDEKQMIDRNYIATNINNWKLV
jgi:hypothetical protein